MTFASPLHALSTLRHKHLHSLCLVRLTLAEAQSFIVRIHHSTSQLSLSPHLSQNLVTSTVALSIPVFPTSNPWSLALYSDSSPPCCSLLHTSERRYRVCSLSRYSSSYAGCSSYRGTMQFRPVSISRVSEGRTSPRPRPLSMRTIDSSGLSSRSLFSSPNRNANRCSSTGTVWDR
jgi:hypothetical protein